MTKTTQRKQRDRIREAIEPMLEKYLLESNGYIISFQGYIENDSFQDALVAAMLPLMPTEMPTTKETEDKITAIDDMIKHVDKVLDIQLNYGLKKWEAAIKYLIEVKEKGWDIAVMWIHLNSDELKFKKDIPSIGSIMKDPEAVIKDWMPIAHAVKTDTHREPQEPTEFMQADDWTPAPERK